MVDTTKQLRDDRRKLMELRENAQRIIAQHPGTDLGNTVAEYCQNLDLPISSINAALKLSGES